MSNKSQRKRDVANLWDRPGFLIRRLHQIHVAMFLEECIELNVTPVQFGILTVLFDGHTLDQYSIANQIGVDRNTAADVLRRLERRGFVERPASVVDKRAKLARITAAGREFVKDVQPAMIRAQRRLMKPLNGEEQETLMSLMSKLMEANNDESRAPLRPKN